MTDTPQSTWFGFDRDEVAYIAPMAAFLLLMTVGNSFKEYAWVYPAAYIARAIAAGVLLIALRRYYTRISWNYWWLGVIAGVIGIVQWIGMDSLLQPISIPIHIPLSVSRLFGMTEPLVKVLHPFALNHEDAFNPFAYFASPAAAWSWTVVRIASASLVVPFMEELFWRDYLWRRMDSPNDFKLAAVGTPNWTAIIIVSVAFSFVHVQMLTAFVWGMMIAGLLVYTRSLGACIIMHGVTNLLLGLYVLWTKQWAWW